MIWSLTVNGVAYIPCSPQHVNGYTTLKAEQLAESMILSKCEYLKNRDYQLPIDVTASMSKGTTYKTGQTITAGTKITLTAYSLNYTQYGQVANVTVQWTNDGGKYSGSMPEASFVQMVAKTL